MPDYRIFLLTKDGRVAGPSASVTRAADREAVEKAQEIAAGLDFEIWDGPRIVIRGPDLIVR
jgi:hypothetical protein